MNINRSYANIHFSIIFGSLLVTLHCSKTLMVLLVCLTFVGQAMASTIMPYQMMAMAGMSGQVAAQSEAMPMTNHSNHNMSSDAVDNATVSTEDCCTQVCNCFMGGCSSVAALMKGVSGNTPIADLASKILSYSTLALSQPARSLYRPPILS
ncbi:MAG: hypothetical protein ACJAXH_000725 [Colwellia sp.]